MLHPSIPNTNSTAIQISPQDEVHTDTSYPQSVWRQFQVLSRRSFLCSQRDKVCYNNTGKSPFLEIFLRNLNQTKKFRNHFKMIQYKITMHIDVYGVNNMCWHTD
jgi:hypothetical protein